MVVLDLMLSGVDGLEVPGKLRGFSDACIMLTAEAEDVDRVVGLSVDADDPVSSRCLHGSWSHAFTPCCARATWWTRSRGRPPLP